MPDDPARPAGSRDASTAGRDDAARSAGCEEALDTVRAVLAWYTEQIITERRSTEPDPARLERLLAEHRACAADQQALREAGPQERARIAADYAARYRELTGP